MPAQPSVRCSQPSSCCHWARGVLPGFGLFALLGIFVLTRVGHWARTHGFARLAPRTRKDAAQPAFSAGRVRGAMAVLLALIFCKYFYLASLTSYYTFYLIEPFPCGGAQRPDHAVHIPRGGGAGHHLRWAAGR